MRAGTLSDPPVVLIAENDAMIADLIAQIVELGGYTPLVAHSSQRALELARERHPALLITEAMMPELDGVGLIAAPCRETGASMPTILLTTSESVPANAAGATELLFEPFHLRTLQAQLSRLLPPSHYRGTRCPLPL